ncbi:hypothetical protein DID88_006642 [Monilinia fructigena]|uniref:Uncharacterized protein n=1 Tax=Monilinia fructigena TaxID=38457 RepID=A0A395IFN6_9HELO|nr:hypothetical protein DID88_006642 [Monilinia fructigena]
MPSKFSKLPPERKSSKVKKSVLPAISTPNPPKTLSKEDKPLPPIPKFSTGAILSLLLFKSAGLGLTIPAPKKITGMETDDTSATNTNTDHNTIIPLLLTSPEVEPEMVIAENDEGVGEEDEDEKMEVRDAMEMTIVPVRARLIYIGGKGLTLRGGAEGR